MISALLLMVASPQYAADHAAARARLEELQAPWLRCLVNKARAFATGPDNAESVTSAVMSVCAHLSVALSDFMPEEVALGLTDRMSLEDARRAVNSIRERGWRDYVAGMRGQVLAQVITLRAGPASNLQQGAK